MADSPVKFTKHLAFATISATFATWFPMGYSVSALNGPQYVVLNWIRSVKCSRLGGTFGMSRYDISEDHDRLLWCHKVNEVEEKEMLAMNSQLNVIWAVCSSSMCLGAIIGCLLAPLLMKQFGVKLSVLISSGTVASGCLLCSLGPISAKWELLLTGRIIIGLGLGLMCVITPVYTTEVTPASLRGATGTLPSIMYVSGLICGTILGFPQIFGNDSLWPYLVAAPIVTIAIAFLLLRICPETPRYLFITKGDEEEARKALMWLRMSDDVEPEIKEMQAEVEKYKDQARINILGLFKDPFLRNTALLITVPMLAQQFSGFYCVTFYASSIFAAIGLSTLASMYAMCGVWAANFAASIASMFLVDRLGRRSLLSTSHAIMIVSLLLFVLCSGLTERGYKGMTYGSVAAMPLFMAGFALGSAPVPWILPGELFAQKARGAAASYAATVSWTAALLTTLLFPFIVVYLKYYTFLIFMVLLILATVFIMLKLPETKGKTIEEIQSELRKEEEPKINDV